MLNVNLGIANVAGLTRSQRNVRGGSLENSAPPRCPALGTLPWCLLRIVVCSGAFVTCCLDGGAFLLFFSFHSAPSEKEMLIFDCYSASSR